MGEAPSGVAVGGPQSGQAWLLAAGVDTLPNASGRRREQ